MNAGSMPTQTLRRLRIKAAVSSSLIEKITKFEATIK
jgi:hypothetical protein